MNGPIIAELRQQLIDTYEPLIDKTRPVALIDFPAAINCGDHAIWLGEKALLHHLGITPAYQCSMESYDRDALAAAVKDGTILMHGGGNFGDVYKYHQFRLQVLKEFPDNQVIVFPQSMMFYSTKSLKHTAELFEVHGKAVITARDALTYYKMSKYFGPKTKVLHAPDMALMLKRLPRRQKPKFDIVWLNRADLEAANVLPAADIAKLGEASNQTLHIVPAKDQPMVVSEFTKVGTSLCVTDWFKCRFTSPEDVEKFVAYDFDTKSEFWINWALMILSLGKVVITDRLHGHILCQLAGIPHILLNNNYGKNFTYYDTWSKDTRGCWIVPNATRALQLAQEVVAKLGAA